MHTDEAKIVFYELYAPYKNIVRHCYKLFPKIGAVCWNPSTEISFKILVTIFYLKQLM